MNGQALFSRYHEGACLALADSSVRNYLAKMNGKQAIILKISDVHNLHIQKLNNAGEIFADITTRFCTAQIKGQLNFELSGRSSPPWD